MNVRGLRQVLQPVQELAEIIHVLVVCGTWLHEEDHELMKATNA